MVKLTSLNIPSWGIKLRKNERSKKYVLTCSGCRETIQKSFWNDHPLVCQNPCGNKKILLEKHNKNL